MVNFITTELDGARIPFNSLRGWWYTYAMLCKSDYQFEHAQILGGESSTKPSLRSSWAADDPLGSMNLASDLQNSNLMFSDLSASILGAGKGVSWSRGRTSCSLRVPTEQIDCCKPTTIDMYLSSVVRRSVHSRYSYAVDNDHIITRGFSISMEHVIAGFLPQHLSKSQNRCGMVHCPTGQWQVANWFRRQLPYMWFTHRDRLFEEVSPT